MTVHHGSPADRAGRRKQRTRQAMIHAAQQFLAEGRHTVPVQEITERADVGTGSFYNHFATKEELFNAAVMAAIDGHGALMDSFTEGIEDPAEVFTQSFRLTGRLHRRYPELSKVIINWGPVLVSANKGLVPRARRDVQAAVDAGRFTAPDIELAMTVVAGATMSLAVLLHTDPERDDASATDAVTTHVLRALGVGEDDISALIALPLPGWG